MNDEKVIVELNKYLQLKQDLKNREQFINNLKTFITIKREDNINSFFVKPVLLQIKRSDLQCLINTLAGTIDVPIEIMGDEDGKTSNN